MDKLPKYSEDLIYELDKEIPEQCPSLDMETKEIYFYAGKREVIRELKTLLFNKYNIESEQFNSITIKELLNKKD